jgi:LmbE family N-acetylglucosaminyl deacetylase
MNHDMTFFGKRICFFGAHPDDIEIGCGALISHISGQTDLRVVTLSDNQKNPMLRDVVAEHHRSMKILGVPEEKVIVGKFETRRFPQFRQEILEYLLEMKNSFHPDIVFLHTKSDLHQDHVTLTDEGLRAFRGTTVLGYDVIRSSYGFFPHFLVEVNETDVNRKIQALAEYHTYDDKYYFDPELTRSILVKNGALAERKFAEGFDILRIIGVFGSAQ